MTGSPLLGEKLPIATNIGKGWIEVHVQKYIHENTYVVHVYKYMCNIYMCNAQVYNGIDLKHLPIDTTHLWTGSHAERTHRQDWTQNESQAELTDRQDWTLIWVPGKTYLYTGLNSEWVTGRTYWYTGLNSELGYRQYIFQWIYMHYLIVNLSKLPLVHILNWDIGLMCLHTCLKINVYYFNMCYI